MHIRWLILFSLIETLGFGQKLGIEPFERSGLWGFRQKKSRHIVVQPTYKSAALFEDNWKITPVLSNNGWGFCDTAGKEIIPCQFEKVVCITDWGCFAVCKAQKWGIYDSAGTLRQPCRYDQLRLWCDHQPIGIQYCMYANQLGLVIRDGKFGYLSKELHEFIACQYEDALEFSENLAAVKSNGKWGYIDPIGRTVIPFIYSDARNFNLGVAFVKAGKWWGAIDPTQKVIVSFQYEAIKSPRNSFDTKGRSEVRQHGAWNIIHIDDYKQ